MLFGQQKESVEVAVPGAGTFVFSELRFAPSTGEVTGVISNETGENWPKLEFVVEAQANCAGQREALRLIVIGSLGEDPTAFSGNPTWDPRWATECAAKYFTVEHRFGKSVEQIKRDAASAKTAETAAEIKRKADAEQSAKYEANARAEEREAARARKVRDAEEAIEEYSRRRADAEYLAKRNANCATLRKATIDRKVSDLTVRETQLVNACQAVGLY